MYKTKGKDTQIKNRFLHFALLYSEYDSFRNRFHPFITQESFGYTKIKVVILSQIQMASLLCNNKIF